MTKSTDIARYSTAAAATSYFSRLDGTRGPEEPEYVK
jgi:hypothetical protein